MYTPPPGREDGLRQVVGGAAQYSSIHPIRGIDRLTFQIGDDDNLIRKNSFDVQFATVINDSMTRKAITRK